MLHITASFKVVMGRLFQKGCIGKLFCWIGFLKIDVLLMNHDADRKGFQCLKPSPVHILKVFFRKRIDFREMALVAQDHIAVICKYHIALNIHYRLICREIDLIHNRGRNFFYYLWVLGKHLISEKAGVSWICASRRHIILHWKSRHL